MDVRTLFNEKSKIQKLKEGIVIFEEGSKGHLMYVILEGEVEIVIAGKTIDTIKAGQMLGEMAMIDERSRSATAITKTDCQMVSLDRDHFYAMISEQPIFAQAVLQTLAQRLRRANFKLFE